MILYLSIFFVIVFIYAFSYKNAPRSKWVLALVMISLGVFVGISDMLGGYDRYIYGELFDGLSEDITSGHGYKLSSIFLLYSTEWGYTGFNLLMSHFTSNRYIFICVLTLIIYVLLFISIKKYTNNYPFAVLLFLGLWFFFTFTYLRQVIAASIAWLAIEYAIDRKPWYFFAIVLIAYGFHNSAIILTPLYFIPFRKYSQTTVIAVMAVCLILGVTGLPDLLFSGFGSLSGNEERVADFVEQDAKGAGFRPEYLLEAIVFLWFILRNYSMFDEKNKTQLVLLNMALIFCAILLFFIRSDNGGRLSWFYMIGIIAVLTYIATKDRIINSFTVIMLFMSLTLYTRVYLSWQVYNNLYPYKTFFTNGHRDPDFSYEHYEYDHKYDVDKFYKK